MTSISARAGRAASSGNEHPWIVISVPVFHRKASLVLAVPCTSVDVEHAFDVPLPPGSFVAYKNVTHPLSTKRPCRIAKARKIRHLSIDRVIEVVGKVTNEDILRRIHAEIAAAVGMR
ncbi:MAG: type II toxin-antitoxin system PemK/MazF family toxin [Myxococcales bacterium]|nr:type II toxin-antitoxin system PemK/MazF family toxin [Myxococcales bacterium]